MTSKANPSAASSVAAIGRAPTKATPTVHETVRRTLKVDHGSNGDSVRASNGHPGIFFDREGQPRVLRGVTLYSGAPRLAELAGRIGFETVWIEMEHGPTDYDQAEHICMAAEVAGAIPTIRVSDGQRSHVLRALEVGAQIVVVPMVQTADQAKQVVEYGKFAPLGARGYNMRSRGVNYGLGDKKSIFKDANSRTYLFAQIETVQAVENLDAICAVEGLSGVFIGPGDLSVSIGATGELDGDRMIDIVTSCVRRARAAGKHAGILVPPGRMLEAAVEAGCDLVFYCGDVSDLGTTWMRLLPTVSSKAQSK